MEAKPDRKLLMNQPLPVTSSPLQVITMFISLVG